MIRSATVRAGCCHARLSWVRLALLGMAVLAPADDPEPGEQTLVPGLVATYSAPAMNQPATRVDPDVLFNWGDAGPDLRVPAGHFQVVWRGKLNVAASGQYAFHLYLCGRAQVRVAGREAVKGTSGEPAWISGQPLELEQGDHHIEVRFTKTAVPARIGLYWESTRFALEPIAARWLSHERPAGGDGAAFERGEELVRAFRCGACHSIPGLDGALKAPSLARDSRLRFDWLVDWLGQPHAAGADARMPDFGLSADEARGIAGFLSGRADGVHSATQASAVNGRPEAGEALARSIGCLACHRIGEAGTAGLFGGGSLDRIGRKRSRDFLRRWLKDPAALVADHRMPVFSLSNQELDDLASYLAGLVGPEPQAGAGAQHAAEPADGGEQLAAEFRCAACHEMTRTDKPPVVAVAWGSAAWERSCLGKPDRARRRPGFELPDADRAAVREFLCALPAQVARQSEVELGRRLLGERNCLSCHGRDLDRGLEPATWLGQGERQGELELAKLRGELEPPALTAVGDKFHDATLAKLVEGGLTPRRPWIKVRMPKFRHTPEERDAIVRFLVEHDRIPEPAPSAFRPAVATDSPGPTAALVAGQQLVSARGFGCMSCHTLGKHEPKGVTVNARGSDLVAIGSRVRHEWFRRWVRDPARTVPGMEMPAIVVPVAGVLDGRIDRQIESLWQALNSPSFVVPSDRDTAQQILSLGPGDAPVILRDVLYDCPPGSGWCAHAFAIGLPNGHNVLFDLDTMSLRAWWYGDFARQRTEGKTWLWEPAGLPAWNNADRLPTIALRNTRTGETLLPETDAQTTGQLHSWLSRTRLVSFTCRLRFAGGISVWATELIQPAVAVGDDPVGFDRLVTVRGVPAGFEPLVLHSGGTTASAAPKEWRRPGPLGETVATALFESSWEKLALNRSAEPNIPSVALAMTAKVSDSLPAAFETRIRYSCTPTAATRETTLARSPDTAARGDSAHKPTSLAVAPGFEVIRLPLNSSAMPTAITFQPDGTAVVASLKGQVVLARDTNGDGFEDTWQPFSDHLAAPYGLLIDGDAVLVSHKPELLRLEDSDGDDRVDRSTIVASGWGYNEDYHDWTFGVLRDSRSNLYIATASDYAQKDRPRTARGQRGQFLRVGPDGKIETLARGLRYPTGLAMNRDGAIFFSDNQGVQNTFNEINHLVPGSRYGVPALDDPPSDKDPWPERAAAIQVPHPWTRSVNGVCFLESGGKWGPFEGHGIGCEYDTRGLIRFSLQEVGDTYQGACYPFTRPEDQVPPGERLLGPICCAVSPAGDLYVGGLRDSGWGGGNNIGELVRIRPAGPPPLGIREVRAFREGFVIEFTGEVDEPAAADPAKYSLASYRRIWQGTYATPDSDRRSESLQGIFVAADNRSVVLRLEDMRPGFVYDIHVAAIGPDRQSLWPADAYYTLNQIPDRDGQP